MIKEFIIKEIQEQIFTFKMVFYTCVILIVMIINGFVFTINYNKQITKYNEFKNENLTNIRKEASSLFKLLFYEQRQIKPPSKFAFISEAEETMLPNGMWINFFEESQPEFYKGQNVFFSQFNSVDWIFILIYIIGFICIAFSYNAFSGEKEKGTLKLIFSNSIPKWKLIVGKLVGILICICIPFIIGCMLNLLIIQMNPAVSFGAVDYILILVFMSVAILFISFNILLGFFVSTLTSRPIHSLNMVLVIWIFLSIILPSISWISAKKMVDISSNQKIAEQIESEEIKIMKSGKYYTGWDGSDAGKPPNKNVRSRAEWVNVTTNLRMNIWNSFLNDNIKQTNIAILYSKFSPVSVFRFIGERISDNGFYGFLRFHNQVMNYKNVFKDFAIDKDKQDKDSYHLIWNESWAAKTFFSQKPVDFNEIPKFEYQKASLKEVLNNCLWDFLILVLWNIVLFTGTFVAFLRYDMR